MRRIFTLSLALVCLTVISNKVFSQTVPPTPVATNLDQSGSGSACSQAFANRTVTEGFETTTGTAGFVGSDWSRQSNGSGQFYLAVANNGSAPVGKYSLTTPTYTKDPNSTVYIKFQLGGNAKISTVNLSLQTSTLAIIDLGPVTLVSGTACVRVDNIQPNSDFRFIIDITTSTAGTLNFDNWYITPIVGNAPTPLPVHFSSVAVRKATEGALVTWNVGTELNVSGYDIEKSTDGRSFTKIGFVAASNLSAYNFTDAKAGAINFYRVKSVDIDGKFGYSTVVVLNGGASSVVVKAFMSDKNTLTVQHDAAQAGSRISVISMDGRVVKVQQPAADAQQTKVDLSSAQTGLYIIRYDNGQGGTQSIKVAK